MNIRLVLLALIVLLLGVVLYIDAIPQIRILSSTTPEKQILSPSVVVAPQSIPLPTKTNSTTRVSSSTTESLPSTFEESSVISTPATTSISSVEGTPRPLRESYLQITDGCGPYYEGTCARIRSGPGTTYPVVEKARTGMVLKTSGALEADGRTWYKIIFDEWLRYPERKTSDWYVAGDLVEHIEVPTYDTPQSSSTKAIFINRSKQMLYAYEGDTLFMKEPVSTGLELSPTPRGVFSIYKKMPSRYMQGPLPGISDQYYDLPGVPWTLYFTQEGGAIHGAYWHSNFGQQWSHGCVNLPIDKARALYEWADIGTPVTVRD